MYNKRFLGVLIIVIIVCMAVFIFRDRKVNNTPNNYRQDMQLNMDYINFEDRDVLRTQEWLLVGNTKAELENEFYDFKLRKNDSGVIELYINKLWYKTCNENYLEEEYLVKIVEELIGSITNISTEDMEERKYQLYKYIEETYIKVKKEQEYTNKTIIEELIIESTDEEKILKITIYKGE